MYSPSFSSKFYFQICNTHMHVYLRFHALPTTSTFSSYFLFFLKKINVDPFLFLSKE